MNIDIKETEKGITALLDGRLDTAAATEVGADFRKMEQWADRDIVIDCSKLQYICSSGLRLFISLKKVSAAKKGSIAISNMSDEIRNVFTMTGFLRLFDILD